LTEQIALRQVEALALIMVELCIGNMIIGGTNMTLLNKINHQI